MPAAQIVAEQYVDPVFAPCPGVFCLDFRLDGSSPLVDAGLDGPAGGQSAVDLDGNPRTIGAHVDIGAYESDVLFSNGFDRVDLGALRFSIAGKTRRDGTVTVPQWRPRSRREWDPSGARTWPSRPAALVGASRQKTMTWFATRAT